jgi:hypothetical protein
MSGISESNIFNCLVKDYLYYIASPYSSKFKHIKERRYDSVCKAVSVFLKAGFMAMSPISLSHPIVRYGVPEDWSFWNKFDTKLMSKCSALIVLTLPGWEKSKGVTEEIRIAESMDMLIYYISLKELLNERHSHHCVTSK